MTERSATTFMVAAIKKPRRELRAILDDQTKLTAAADYHGIPSDWARFWISEELNRNSRRN